MICHRQRKYLAVQLCKAKGTMYLGYIWDTHFKTNCSFSRTKETGEFKKVCQFFVCTYVNATWGILQCRTGFPGTLDGRGNWSCGGLYERIYAVRKGRGQSVCRTVPRARKNAESCILSSVQKGE